MSKLKFESTVKLIPYPQQQVYNKLSDLKNLESLKNALEQREIPKDLPGSVSPEQMEKMKGYLKNITSTTDEAQMDSPIGTITLKIVDRDEPKCIKGELEGAPIAVTLWIQLLPHGDHESKMRVTVQSEVSIFMKSMVKKPLKEAVEQIAQVLSSLPYNA